MLRAKYGNPAGQKHYRAGLHSQIAPADVSSVREQLTKGKQSIDAFVRTLQHKSSAANAAEGRRCGIVYPAGGTKQVPLHKELCDRHLILLGKICCGMHRSKTCLIMCLADSLLHMQLVNAWVSIAIVRQRFKCQLPIELFYDGESEMPPFFRSLFQVHPEISCHKPCAML